MPRDPMKATGIFHVTHPNYKFVARICFLLKHSVQ